MKVRSTFGASVYEIDLVQMTQTNVNTGFSRAIRCTEIAAGSDFECSWQWLDDQQDWQVFAPAHASEIAAAFSQGSTSVDITFPNGSVYEIDFESMRQTNKASGFSRPMRQEITLSDAAIAAQPEDPDHMCPVCYESRNLTAMLLPCRHVLCTRCAKRVQGMSNKCPMCRAEIQYIFNLGTSFTPVFSDK
jgi:hypothetical protein